MPAKGKGKAAKAKKASPPAATTSGSASSSAPAPPSQAEYDEMALDFENELPPFGYSEWQLEGPYGTAASTDAASSPASSAHMKRGIKSNESLKLEGPMDVDGSIKSMGGVRFDGDFSVRDKIEAYGNVDVYGNLTCK